MSCLTYLDTCYALPLVSRKKKEKGRDTQEQQRGRERRGSGRRRDRKASGQRQLSCISLNYSSNSFNRKGWTRLKPGAQNSIRFSHVDGRTRVLQPASAASQVTHQKKAALKRAECRLKPAFSIGCESTDINVTALSGCSPTWGFIACYILEAITEVSRKLPFQALKLTSKSWEKIPKFHGTHNSC